LKTFLVSLASCVADFALWLSEDILDTSHLPSFFLAPDVLQLLELCLCVRDVVDRLKTFLVSFAFCVAEFALWLSVDILDTSHLPSFFLDADAPKVLYTCPSLASVKVDRWGRLKTFVLCFASYVADFAL
jgi:hypothetical protein